MILNFIFSNAHKIILVVWMIFLIVVTLRFFRLGILKNIKYTKLLGVAIGINIFYVIFISWGQYFVWVNGNEMTKALASLPLPKEVPLHAYTEWIRPLFNHDLGYFLFYVWGRFWQNMIVLFLVSGVIYFVFRTWEFYRGGFKEEGPLLILILMLISGWPGVIVSVFLGFVLSILLFGYHYVKSIVKKTTLSNVVIEPAFIFATLVSLFFGDIILNLF